MSAYANWFWKIIESALHFFMILHHKCINAIKVGKLCEIISILLVSNHFTLGYPILKSV